MKTILNFFFPFALGLFMVSCGGPKTDTNTGTTPEAAPANSGPAYDEKRGEGKFTDIVIGEKLDAAKAEIAYEKPRLQGIKAKVDRLGAWEYSPVCRVTRTIAASGEPFF